MMEFLVQNANARRLAATQVGLPDLRIKKTDLRQARDRRAIRTVDFLLYRFGVAVKKTGVKTHDRTRRHSAE
jgi:hypothetical protein